MLTRERIKEILSRSAWRTTRAETAELLRLALVGFDMENAAREHQGHPSFMEETMTETTEPTREQLIEMIAGMVNRTDDPQWMRDKEDSGTQIEWFVAALRLALRTLDAEAKLAAMTERAEKAERRQADAEAAELRRANEKMDATARAEELSRRNIELARALPDERVRGACQVIRAMPIPLDALLPAEREALKVFAAWLDSLDTVR